MTSLSGSANPYQPPTSQLFDEASATDRSELIAYMNGAEPTESAAEYYSAQLLRHDAGLHPRPMGAAFLFGSVWCFWRKLYLVGCVLYLIELLVGTLIYLTAVAILPGGESSPLSSSIGFLALPLIRIPFSFMANRLYLRAATRAVAKVRARGLSGPEALQELRRRGGTSTLGVGLAILINLTVRVLDRLAA